MNKSSVISIAIGTWGFACGAMWAISREPWVFIAYGVGIIILRYIIDTYSNP